MVTKIAFVGKPEMGKTTIKKVIFDGVDPSKLALFPLEATIGISRSVHEFMDLKISLLDTPGQSLPILLKDEKKQINYFENTGAIIYIFDFPTWIADSQDVIDDILSIYKINKKLKINAKIILFLHKVDLLIDKKIGSRLDIIRMHILKQLNIPEDLPIYFTSLHPDLIYTVFNAISDIFSNFSKDSSNLKEIIKKYVKGLSKTICFVSNQEDNLIIQVPTNDFDTSTLYYLYSGIDRLTKLSEENLLKSKFINAGPKILCMKISNISNFHLNFKNLLFFSETLEENDLSKLEDDLKEELNQFYK